jgi:hypothetical protein
MIDMSFNKRYINKKNILVRYEQGLNDLISYIQNPDCLIIEDNFSEEVVDIILNDDIYEAREKLEKLIKWT